MVMVIDIVHMEKLYSDGLLYKQYHPEYELIVWNYTPTVQYEKKWNKYTLMSRGLVTDFNGNILSPCMNKFFNIEELDSIPNEEFDVFMKYDGSYISMFYYNNEWIFSSRGSFTSNHAILAKKIFNEKYKNFVKLNKKYNYIFELIGLSNQIVIRYSEDDLVLLTSFNVETLEENDIFKPVEFDRFRKAIKYDGITDYKILKQLIPDDEEGYVIKFKSGFRMKIKGVEYVKLHKLMSDISTVSIWENLANNVNFDDILSKLPDETYNWVKETKEKILNDFDIVKNKCLIIFDELKHIENKKEFAMKIKDDKHASILFNMFDGKPYEHIIWKIIKPENKSINSLNN